MIQNLVGRGRTKARLRVQTLRKTDCWADPLRLHLNFQPTVDCTSRVPTRLVRSTCIGLKTISTWTRSCEPYPCVGEGVLTLAKPWIANGALVGRVALRLASPTPFLPQPACRLLFFNLFACLQCCVGTLIVSSSLEASFIVSREIKRTLTSASMPAVHRRARLAETAASRRHRNRLCQMLSLPAGFYRLSACAADLFCQTTPSGASFTGYDRELKSLVSLGSPP